MPEEQSMTGLVENDEHGRSKICKNCYFYRGDSRKGSCLFDPPALAYTAAMVVHGKSMPNLGSLGVEVSAMPGSKVNIEHVWGLPNVLVDWMCHNWKAAPFGQVHVIGKEHSGLPRQ